ncbi:MAG TPA: MotA/TolQ/ExbB proton channel family protein [Gammaproteobacteria bacterium]
MFEIVVTGGWVMVPIILSSVLALAIVVERFWTLRQERIAPSGLVTRVWQMHRNRELDEQRLKAIYSDSPLGRILAAGLVNMHHSREVMKESIEDVGRQVVHELGRFLNTLGTIAAISPLLGLFGTVLGMIKVFNAITVAGIGNPTVLAGGISEALITTVGGLSVAIPSLIFYRFFRGRVDELVLRMEEQALKLVEIIHGEREAGEGTDR